MIDAPSGVKTEDLERVKNRSPSIRVSLDPLWLVSSLRNSTSSCRAALVEGIPRRAKRRGVPVPSAASGTAVSQGASRTVRPVASAVLAV